MQVAYIDLFVDIYFFTGATLTYTVQVLPISVYILATYFICAHFFLHIMRLKMIPCMKIKLVRDMIFLAT